MLKEAEMKYEQQRKMLKEAAVRYEQQAKGKVRIHELLREREHFYESLRLLVPHVSYKNEIPFVETFRIFKEKYSSFELGEGFENNEKTKNLMGPFHKVSLPIYRNDIEMGYAGLLSHLWLPEQREKIEKNKTRKVDIFLDVSGTGKTFNIFGNASTQYMMLCSSIEAASDMRTLDSSFSDLIHTIKEISNPIELIIDAPRIIFSFLFSRLLHLYLLFDSTPDLTPIQYVQCQLNGLGLEMSTLCSDVQKYCKVQKLSQKCLFDYCKIVLEKIHKLKSINVGFALDEASTAEKITHGCCYSWRGTKRGILTVLLENLINFDFNYFIFAGTNFSFADTVQISSTAIKQRSIHTEIVSSFDLVTSMKEYLELHINLDGCENVFQNQLLMKKVNNTRVRVGANIVSKIAEIHTNEPRLPKDEVVKRSMNICYDQLVQYIYRQLEDKKEAYDVQKLIDVYMLTKLGKKSKVYDEVLMEIGITKVQLEKNQPNFLEIREFAVLEGIDKYLVENRSSLLIDACLRRHNEFPGVATELLYFTILCSSKYHKKELRDIPLFKSCTDELPEWTKDFYFEAEMKTIVNFEDLMYFQNLDEMNGKIVKLSPNFHGDIFVLWKKNAKYYYFNLSSKFHKETIKEDEHLKSQHSTDLSRAYIDNYSTESTFKETETKENVKKKSEKHVETKKFVDDILKI